MSFASDIKDEVVRVRVKEGAVKLAELSALTFACGIAEGSPIFRSEEDWIRLADAGMYKAKALKELYYVVSSEEAKKILAEK
jgi:PleD family two-component response regulator